MHWFLAIVVILVVAVVFEIGLLACAMAALLGLMLISRFLARSWISNLEATRDCNRLEAEVGQSIAFVITVRNLGRLPVAWVLIEDMLPRGAIVSRPPRIEVKGHRLAVAMLGPLGARRSIISSISTRGAITRSGRSYSRRATSLVCTGGSGS